MIQRALALSVLWLGCLPGPDPALVLTVEVLWPSPIPCLQVGNRAVLNLDETAGRAGIRVANGGKAPVDLFLRGCDESYRFELAGGKETIREIQCEAIDKLVLDVQGSGLHGTVELSVHWRSLDGGPDSMDAGTDAGIDCYVSALFAAGATQVGPSVYQLPVLEPVGGFDESGLLYVSTVSPSGAGNTCPVSVSISGSGAFSLSYVGGSSSGHNYIIRFGPLISGLDAIAEISAVSPTNSASVQVIGKTWATCPNLANSSCPVLDTSVVLATDGRSITRIDDAGVFASTPLVSNDFSPFLAGDGTSLVTDVAVDSSGHAWVTTKDDICPLDPINGTVRDCKRIQLSGPWLGAGGLADGGVVVAGDSVCVINPATGVVLRSLLDGGSVSFTGDVAISDQYLRFISRGLQQDTLHSFNMVDSGMQQFPLGFTGSSGLVWMEFGGSIFTSSGFIVHVDDLGQQVSVEASRYSWVGAASRPR